MVESALADSRPRASRDLRLPPIVHQALARLLEANSRIALILASYNLDLVGVLVLVTRVVDGAVPSDGRVLARAFLADLDLLSAQIVL